MKRLTVMLTALSLLLAGMVLLTPRRQGVAQLGDHGRLAAAWPGNRPS